MHYVGNSEEGISFWPGANDLFMAKQEDISSTLDILPPSFALRLPVAVWLVVMISKRRDRHPIKAFLRGEGGGNL